jgi:hypothetical protein
MGEDFPLDPSQVQQPQEGEQPQQEQVTNIAVIHPDSDRAAMRPIEEELSPERVHNQEKAQLMAKAMDKSRANYPGSEDINRLNKPYIDAAGNKAGDQYEIEALAKQDGKSLEQVRRYMKSSRRALINYGYEMGKNQIEYGEKLSPDLKVFSAVHKLAERYPELVEKGGLESEDMEVSLQRSSLHAGGLTVIVEHRRSLEGGIYQEEWSAAPMSADRESFSRYTVESQPHGRWDGKIDDDGFDSVKLTRSRGMQDKDAKLLEDLFENTNFDPESEEDGYDLRDNEDDQASYINGHRIDEDTEDPLESDVDKWVDPKETEGYPTP